MFRLFKNILRFAAVIIFIGAALICYARFIEPNMLQVRDVAIQSPRIAAEAEDFKIAVFGDTHFGDYYTTKDFDQLLEEIKKIEPDMVFFTGDLIDHYNLYTGDVGVISDKLSQIDAPYGKYTVFGNHDYGGGAENEYPSIMEAGGFTVLKNQYYAIQELGIAVIGIDDMIIGYGDPSVASWGRPDYFNIIIAHEPDLADQILDYNADLMIAGHTHGRQINLKFFDDYILPPYGKNYISGLHGFDNERKTQLYVNSGVGMTKLPYRFLSPPELTCITLKNTKQK